MHSSAPLAGSLNQNTINNYIAFFNNLEDGLARGELEALTAPTFRFIDPFNDVSGQVEAKKVLQHFIQQIQAPHFAIQQVSWAGNVCFLRWNFSGKFPSGKPWQFPGVSEIHLNDKSQITLHHDHWDASEHFYQHLPLIGRIIRWIKKRIQPSAN